MVHVCVQVGLQWDRLPDHGLLRSLAVLLLLLLPPAPLHLPDRGVHPGPVRHHRVPVRLLRHAAVQGGPSRYSDMIQTFISTQNKWSASS